MAKGNRKRRQLSEAESSGLIPVNTIEAANETVSSRLRELRRQHGLSLRVLADKSGLSANTLSLIENGKTSPSIATLQQIAIALNCPINAFFERNEIREPVLYTKHDQRRVREYSNARLEEVGYSNQDEGLFPFIVSFSPHSDSGPQPLVRKGSEFIYNLLGRVIYRIQGNEYALEPGDSLFFPANLAHTWENPSDDICKVVIVMGNVEK